MEFWIFYLFLFLYCFLISRIQFDDARLVWIQFPLIMSLFLGIKSLYFSVTSRQWRIVFFEFINVYSLLWVFCNKKQKLFRNVYATKLRRLRNFAFRNCTILFHFFSLLSFFWLRNVQNIYVIVFKAN